jgi:HTH-type transcriptional regulator/antitoxin HigA
MEPKLIKTEAEHARALAHIDTLFDARPGTPDGDALDLWVTLVELYEEQAFPIPAPDPLTAIRFRMEQQGLKARDLVPYIGSPSKVSEVLAGQRELSKTMIRKLVDGLGIPAEVLLREPPPSGVRAGDLPEACRSFPVPEMARRGWFPGFRGTTTEAKRQFDRLMTAFLGEGDRRLPTLALMRQGTRKNATLDAGALTAWAIRVMNLARAETAGDYRMGTITPGFLEELAHLSCLESGPAVVREYLNKNGVRLVIERHLPRTHLDGAALKLPDGAPVVALTLRHDRLDNFWFTLFHELAHVALHLHGDGGEVFIDDLSEDAMDNREKAADAMARDGLIPAAEWKAARLDRDATDEQVREFAERQRIHPAIPAGRIRREAGDYTLFTSLVGNGLVRSHFAQ